MSDRSDADADDPVDPGELEAVFSAARAIVAEYARVGVILAVIDARRDAPRMRAAETNTTSHHWLLLAHYALLRVREVFARHPEMCADEIVRIDAARAMLIVPSAATH